MSIFSGLEQIVETDYPLAKRTWYGLGGPADYFIRPKTTEQLREVVERCNENEIRIYVMGFGSNLLIGDDGSDPKLPSSSGKSSNGATRMKFAFM